MLCTIIWVIIWVILCFCWIILCIVLWIILWFSNCSLNYFLNYSRTFSLNNMLDYSLNYSLWIAHWTVLDSFWIILTQFTTVSMFDLFSQSYLDSILGFILNHCLIHIYSEFYPRFLFILIWHTCWILSWIILWTWGPGARNESYLGRGLRMKTPRALRSFCRQHGRAGLKLRHVGKVNIKKKRIEAMHVGRDKDENIWVILLHEDEEIQHSLIDLIDRNSM